MHISNRMILRIIRFFSMEHPMISVLIVTHNNEKDILPCLASLPWEWMPMEVICIDNRSSDRTRKHIRSFMQEKPERAIRTVFNQDNLGYAAAVNQGLRHARGEWICILGPDARLHAGALQTLQKKSESRPRLGMAAPQLLRTDGSVQPSCRRFPELSDVLLELTGLPRLLPGLFSSQWKMTDFDHRSERMVEQPEATCLLIRREAIRQVGLMDERFPIFFNDVDWCKRFDLQGWQILFTPDAKVTHRQGTSVNIRPASMIWKSHQGFYRYFNKYASSPGQKLILLPLGMLLIITASVRGILLIMGIKRAGLNHPDLHSGLSVHKEKNAS